MRGAMVIVAALAGACHASANGAGGASPGRDAGDASSEHHSDADGGPAVDAGPAIAFVDVAQSSGLPSLGGMCVGFEDFNGDGLPDLLLTTQTQTGDLSLDLYAQGQDGSFTGSTLPLTIDTPFSFCSIGDFDNDGLPDVAVALGAKYEVHVLRNLGGNSFQDVATLSTAAATPPPSGFTGVAFADFDADGWLDVLAAPYEPTPGPTGYTCGPNSAGFACTVPNTRCAAPPIVFPGRGGTGFGPAVSVIAATSCGPANANAVAVTDYDGDGRPDVMVANDWGVDALYVQSQTTPLQFTDIAQTLGLKGYNHAMGAAFADYDRDGRLDLYVSDLGSSQFYLGDPGGTLRNAGAAWGIATATMYNSGWAALADDFDSDGYTDLWIANSAVVESYADLTTVALNESPLPPREMSDFVLHNVGGHTFAAVVVPQTLTGSPAIIGGSTAVADFDRDGRLDVAEVVGYPMRFQLMHNEGSTGHWLDVRLVGSSSNRSGIGASITVKQAGMPDVTKLVETTRGSAGASWAVAHFGLAAEAATLAIRWPSGQTQTVSENATDIDRLITVKEP